MELPNIGGIRSLFIIYKLPGIEVIIKRSELNIFAKRDGIAFVAFCKWTRGTFKKLFMIEKLFHAYYPHLISKLFVYFSVA
jgi:hypothetical protein